MTALFRLAKDTVFGWWVTCNVCDHTVNRHTREDAVDRLNVMELRSRLVTAPPCRECADLAEQVDALALERDDLRMVTEMLTAKVAHTEQANTDLRRNVRAAYEPVQVGGCRKVRHTAREAADQHAIEVATRSPAAVLALSGCNTSNPCATLAPPTAQELAVVASGAEVEREVGSTECDLVDGVWTREAA